MYVDLIEQAVQELPLTAIHTPWTEYAWNYGDYPEILRYFQKKGWIVLGGDVLTTELEYTYANWYYNPDPTKTLEENLHQSIAVTEDYLKRFRDRNGTEYLIVFVVTRRFP